MSSPGRTAQRPEATREAPWLTFRATPVQSREGEPISIGVPFARGRVRSLSDVAITDAGGELVESQWQSLASWPDGSVRWALVDFLASAQGGREAAFRVGGGASNRPGTCPLAVHETAEALLVDTGAASFRISRDVLRIRAELKLADSNVRTAIDSALVSASGGVCAPVVREIRFEARGPVRATIRAAGEFRSGADPSGIEFTARLGFFASSGLVRAEWTIHNRRAAKHPGGLWDLGDEGSILFRSFTTGAALEGVAADQVTWSELPGAPTKNCRGERLEIHQASSGGERWNCANHVDRSGKVSLPFRGYRVQAGATRDEGLRASPVVALCGQGWNLSAAIPRFWEQFPKAIEAGGTRLDLHLFPAQRPADGTDASGSLLHELQGGEQKTHTAFFLLEAGDSRRPLDSLAWTHEPLRLALDPVELTQTGAVPRVVPAKDDRHRDALDLISGCVSGPDSFFEKREVIDEFGWRNFGDVYADHENLHATEPRPIISHYNNQYDLILGLLVQFLRTADARWFELANDLALHVIDIDIYHTLEDKSAYNGGLFWQTDHYLSASRSTHRTYSKDSPPARKGLSYGGGPSNEHNYTSGLQLFHYMTGSPAARDAVLGLARWVIDMDDGAKTPLGVVDPGPTGIASSTKTPDYHGPGRGAGNSINALLDAFSLTSERQYLEKAEELIRRCAHPADDISARGLGNPEERWSYLVFFQSLGKYLDLKPELDRRDLAYDYARAAFAAYAKWMLENERPYMQMLDRVEFATESWPAHDVRKSVVFDFAACYADRSLRERFLERAELFHTESCAGVRSFDSRSTTRPMAILLQSAWMRAGFQATPPREEPDLERGVDFGRPAPFESQKMRVKRMLRSPAGLARIALSLLRPASVARLVRCARERRG